MGYQGDGGPSRSRRGKSVRLMVAGERKHGPGADRSSTEDGGCSRNRSNASTIGLEFNDKLPLRGDSFELQLNQGMKRIGTPMKSLINEEMSKEVVKRTSPCLVARLMGLDSLPSPVHVQPKKIGGSGRKISSGCQEKYRRREEHLFHGGNKEQEFKDVFEVTETLEAQGLKKRALGIGKKSPNARHVDLTSYIHQKFLDAKRLSTDETLHNSKELNDALEALGSNKDLFLRFLQEPNSLFAKHLENLRSSPPSPHMSRITILKSAKGNRHERSEECCSINGNANRFSYIQKETPYSSSKSASRHLSHALKNHSSSSSQKLSSLKHESRYEFSSHPTKIVVLKPTLEKAWKMEKTISLPIHAENYEGRWRRRESHIPSVKGFYAGGREKKLHDNLEVLQRSKSSREIAREVTKQMRESVWYSTEKVLSSGIEEYEREKISCIESCMDSLYESGRYHESAYPFNDWSTSRSSSSSYSTESSVCQEAKKRLSARWKVTKHLKEVEHIGRSSSTLGEMLALSDIEIPNRASDASLTAKKESGKSPIEATDRWAISRRDDGRKEGPSRNLSDIISHSSSFPAKDRPKLISKHHTSSKILKDLSDQVHENAFKEQSNQSSFNRSLNRRIHRPQLYKSHGEEHNIPEREIHVNNEVDSTSNIHYSSEAKPTAPELFTDCIADRFYSGCRLPSLYLEDTKIYCLNDRECKEESSVFDILEKDTQPSNHDYKLPMTSESSVFEHASLSLHPQCQLSQLANVTNFEDIEHPSPVSVLETPSEEDNSSSGCFERISADLKELRMQLRLLKMESTNASIEQLEDMDANGEHAVGDYALLDKEEEKLQDFKDESDRDCCYLIDVLTESRMCDDIDIWSCISDESHTSDYPIHISVFDKLERKYSRMASWLKSERKLLFDLINSILANKVISPFHLHPWTDRSNFGPISGNKDLQEHVWQHLLWYHKNLFSETDIVLEPRWLHTILDSELVRNDIEGMLVDELLEQLVLGLILI